MHQPARAPAASTTSRILRAACLLPLAAWAAGSPLLAAEPSRWRLSGSGVWLSPAGDEVTVARPGALGEERTTHTASDAGTGFGLAVEYRWRPAVGVDLGAFLVELDNGFRLEAGGASLADSEPMAVISYALGVNWHLRPGRRIGAFVGGFVAQTTFDDVTFLTEAGRREKLAFDDDYGFGARAGIDVPLGGDGAWSFGADLRYLSTLLESEVAGQDVDLDPVIVAVGVGYRF